MTETRNALVTVITVTHNRGNLIGRAIKSVIGQTYQNIEYIIVDGASTDNTSDVVRSYKDERLMFIQLNQNLSPIECINLAVEKSNGDYFCFLDDDDEYCSRRIEKCINKFSTLDNSYGLVYCWMTYFNSKTGVIDHTHKPQLRGFVGDDVVEEPSISVSGTPTYTIRRNVFLELGGWRSDIGIISDWELAARLCQKWKVDFVPESLVNVFINHNASRMSDKKYYKDLSPRSILFHNHFLSEFNHVYCKYPDRAYPHYENLFRNHLILHHWRDALKYWKKAFVLRPSFRLIALWPGVLIRKY